MSCPNCGNDDWKLASLVYQNGLTHVNTSTTALGVGFTEEGMVPGVGVGENPRLSVLWYFYRLG